LKKRTKRLASVAEKESIRFEHQRHSGLLVVEVVSEGRSKPHPVVSKIVTSVSSSLSRYIASKKVRTKHSPAIISRSTSIALFAVISLHPLWLCSIANNAANPLTTTPRSLRQIKLLSSSATSQIHPATLTCGVRHSSTGQLKNFARESELIDESVSVLGAPVVEGRMWVLLWE
jgi:hypothetical protein